MLVMGSLKSGELPSCPAYFQQLWQIDDAMLLLALVDMQACLWASSMRFRSSSRFASCVCMWSELMSGQCSGKVSCAGHGS
jgi:hypothetical protein